MWRMVDTFLQAAGGDAFRPLFSRGTAVQPSRWLVPRYCSTSSSSSSRGAVGRRGHLGKSNGKRAANSGKQQQRAKSTSSEAQVPHEKGGRPKSPGRREMHTATKQSDASAAPSSRSGGVVRNETRRNMHAASGEGLAIDPMEMVTHANRTALRRTVSLPADIESASVADVLVEVGSLIPRRLRSLGHKAVQQSQMKVRKALRSWASNADLLKAGSSFWQHSLPDSPTAAQIARERAGHSRQPSLDVLLSSSGLQEQLDRLQIRDFLSHRNRPSPALAVGAGNGHSVIVDTSDGTVFTFGSGRNGQLGHGDKKDQLTPTVLSVPHAGAVAAGSYHTAIVTTTGEVWTFGEGLYGKLGHGGTKSVHEPTRVIGGGIEDEFVTAVALGSAHTVILTENGRVYSAGYGASGALGHGDRDSRQEPQMIDPFLLCEDKVVQVEAGSHHTAFVTESGRLYVCGRNDHGQCGVSPMHTQCIPAPQRIVLDNADTEVIAVACGGDHTLVLAADGRVFAFGNGHEGQLGIGSLKDCFSPSAIHFPDLEEGDVPVSIFAGFDRSAVITKHGRLFTFGDGYYGHLGHGSSEDKAVPHEVEHLRGTEVTSVAFGSTHSIAVTADRQVFGFGTCRHGGLGLGEQCEASVPTSIDNMLV